MLTHPGVLMVPAGLATAEGEGRTGRELLTALAAGYEVQCRCARDFIPSTPAHGFRASPVYGILGCAATTAKLMGLDADADGARHRARGELRGQPDRGPAHRRARRGFRRGARRPGAACGRPRSPRRASRARRRRSKAKAGSTTRSPAATRGDLSYTFTGPPQADLDDIVADLGRRWEILDVKFKIYPTPGFNQPVVWLAHDMATQHSSAATRSSTSRSR